MGGQAFEGPRVNGFKLYPEDVVIIGLDTDDGPEHPHYDSRIHDPIEEEFILNAMSQGITDPIHIRKEDGLAVVTAGRRRTRALRLANERLVAAGEPRCRIKCLLPDKGATDNDLVLRNIATNNFRKNDSTLEKAGKAAHMIGARQMTEEEVANAFGVTVKAIQNWLKIAELSKPAKSAVEQGYMSASAAAQLHDLPKAEQQKQVKELVAQAKASGKQPTIKKVKATAKQAKGQPTNQAPSKKVLRFIVEQKKTALSDDFIAGVAFAIGLRDAKSVNGLAAAVAAAAKKPKKKVAPKKQKVAKKRNAPKKASKKTAA